MATRTSPLSSSGFTLIEIMIVIAIIAGALAAGATLFNSSSQKRSSVRELAIMSRDLRSVSRLKNSTMRIVIDQNDEKGHSYWVESAPGVVTRLSEEREKELERLTSAQREEEQPKSQFSMDSRVLKKPKQLPRGLFFDGVEFSNRAEAPSGATAYIHFFPQGLADDAVIHLTDRKNLHWTIAINPLTGRADVFERKLSIKELRGL